MKRTFACGAATKQGAWPVQEDGYFLDPVSGFFALADGFGGRGNGDMAAKAALDGARRAAGSPSRGQPAEWQRALLDDINKKSIQWNEKRPPASRGGCSLLLAGADRERRQLAVSQCGACSAILLRAGRWLPLLTPQAAPRVSAESALEPDQALGLGAGIAPESRVLPWEAGDILFLFSSGVDWQAPGFLAELEAGAALRPAGADLAALTALAAEAGASPWNQTVLAVEALI